MRTTSILVSGALNLLVTWAAVGQSSFWLNNIGPNLNAPVFDAQANLLEGSSYLAELWGGATPDSLTPVLSFYSRQRVFAAFLTGAGAGYFRDTYAGRVGADHPTVLTVPSFGWAWLEVRAWDSRLGATYEAVAASGIGGYGESAMFYAQGTSPDLLTPGATLIGLESFSLRPVVPEPSTVAFLLVALPFLLFHRCCKRE